MSVNSSSKSTNENLVLRCSSSLYTLFSAMFCYWVNSIPHFPKFVQLIFFTLPQRERLRMSLKIINFIYQIQCEPLITKTNYYAMLTYDKHNLKLTGILEPVRPSPLKFVHRVYLLLTSSKVTPSALYFSLMFKVNYKMATQ